MIFSFRVFYRTIARGAFHCQRCGGDRPYRLKSGRSWLTLFFLVPVIPLTKAGEHVRCAECGTRYRIGVLSIPTVAVMQQALPAGMRAAVTAMLRAGGPVSARSRQRAVETIREAGLADYDDQDLARDLSGAQSPAQRDEDLATAIRTLMAQLAGPSREWFLADVVRIGLADGPLTDDQRLTARDVAACLGMTPEHGREVVSLTEERAAAG